VKGSDIRQAGSGNVGALNAMHQVGVWGGLLVLLVDAAKGAAAVLLPGWVEAPTWSSYLTGVAAVVGHNWPVFLRFRGGKGAATTLGIALVILPKLTLIALGPTLLIALLTRNVATGVGMGFITLNVLAIVTGQDTGKIALGLLLTTLVVVSYGIANREQIIAAIRARRLRRLLFDRNWNP
jgi:glycerol-3-phosphate acyltransferase PlsY